jgi:hypothetical protein
VAGDHEAADRELPYRHVDAADLCPGEPSFDHSPTTVAPVRESRTHLGAAPATEMFDETPFWAARYCIATPLPGVTTTITCGEPGDSLSRIITPAFVHRTC